MRFFFTTAPMPCPYLPGRLERRLVTELDGADPTGIHDALSQAGFRRSHGVAYAPACRDCNACVAVRVRTFEFEPNRTQARILTRNRLLKIAERPPQATSEQYGLFRNYQSVRHRGGEMARMDFFDYQLLIEDTPVETVVFECREQTGRLVAACLADRLADGYSAVYSFFDPALNRASLGTWMILTLIDRARDRGLPYVYLGFWIDECRKMSYKVGFRPLEAFTVEGWRLLTVGNTAGVPDVPGENLALSAATAVDGATTDPAPLAVLSGKP
ncbi:MAG: arginyltransferase [Rhodospirillales bacterium]|nr:arginyltransferase [Rhodospirillales bacterium]